MSEPTREEIMQAAAGDNAGALEFLRAFARRAHFVDDLADDPIANTPTALAASEAEWLICIAANQFFQQHRGQLVPVMVLALNAWVDSNEPKWKARYRDEVLAGLANEVFWLVAWLTGGWPKLRQVSSKFRDYDCHQDNPTIVEIKEHYGLGG